MAIDQQRYGWQHQKERARVKAQMEANGGAICWRCGKMITPDQPWDLGHDDIERDEYRGPEHRKCNRATIIHRGHSQPTQEPPAALGFFDVC